jgi:uncharacterized protein
LGYNEFPMKDLLTHNALNVTRHTVVLPHLPAAFQAGGRPFRLVQISDLHFYEYTEAAFYQQVAREIERLEPDVLMVTGDLIHYGPHYVRAAGEFLAGLRAREAKMAVIGNHDYADGARSAHVQAMLSEAGYRVLKNDHLCLVREGGEKFWFAGLDDYKYGRPDLQQALAGIPRDDAVVLLAHNPLHFDVVTRDPQTPVDLVFSGHTHGGHVYIPFLGPIYRYVFKMKYRYGLYHQNNTRLYVTSGLGSAAFYLNLGFYKRAFPRFRFNTYPEIAVHDLVGALPQGLPYGREPIEGSLPLPEKAR